MSKQYLILLHISSWSNNYLLMLRTLMNLNNKCRIKEEIKDLKEVKEETVKQIKEKLVAGIIHLVYKVISITNTIIKLTIQVKLLEDPLKWEILLSSNLFISSLLIIIKNKISKHKIPIIKALCLKTKHLRKMISKKLKMKRKTISLFLVQSF